MSCPKPPSINTGFVVAGDARLPWHRLALPPISYLGGLLRAPARIEVVKDGWIISFEPTSYEVDGCRRGFPAAHLIINIQSSNDTGLVTLSIIAYEFRGNSVRSYSEEILFERFSEWGIVKRPVKVICKGVPDQRMGLWWVSLYNLHALIGKWYEIADAIEVTDASGPSGLDAYALGYNLWMTEFYGLMPEIGFGVRSGSNIPPRCSDSEPYNDPELIITRKPTMTIGAYRNAMNSTGFLTWQQMGVRLFGRTFTTPGATISVSGKYWMRYEGYDNNPTSVTQRRGQLATFEVVIDSDTGECCIKDVTMYIPIETCSLEKRLWLTSPHGNHIPVIKLQCPTPPTPPSNCTGGVCQSPPWTLPPPIGITVTRPGPIPGERIVRPPDIPPPTIVADPPSQPSCYEVRQYYYTRYLNTVSTPDYPTVGEFRELTYGVLGQYSAMDLRQAIRWYQRGTTYEYGIDHVGWFELVDRRDSRKPVRDFGANVITKSRALDLRTDPNGLREVSSLTYWTIVECGTGKHYSSNFPFPKWSGFDPSNPNLDKLDELFTGSGTNGDEGLIDNNLPPDGGGGEIWGDDEAEDPTPDPDCRIELYVRVEILLKVADASLQLFTLEELVRSFGLKEPHCSSAIIADYVIDFLRETLVVTIKAPDGTTLKVSPLKLNFELYAGIVEINVILDPRVV